MKVAQGLFLLAELLDIEPLQGLCPQFVLDLIIVGHLRVRLPLTLPENTAAAMNITNTTPSSCFLGSH